MTEKSVGKTVKKLLKIGESAAITLPPDYLKKFNLEPGEDYVEIFYNDLLIVKPLPKGKLEAQHRKLKRDLRVME
jgi:antitoxin component of MazEF toxin-antitoxin module